MFFVCHFWHISCSSQFLPQQPASITSAIATFTDIWNATWHVFAVNGQSGCQYLPGEFYILSLSANWRSAVTTLVRRDTSVLAVGDHGTGM
eukprot:scaffold12043_cov73-Cylindrotheca_fusiformis.AAC.2